MWISPDEDYELILFGKNITNSIVYDTGAIGTRLAGTNFLRDELRWRGGSRYRRDSEQCLRLQLRAGSESAPVGCGAVRGESPQGQIGQDSYQICAAGPLKI